MKHHWIDKATEVREGEEFDSKKLLPFFKKELGLEGEELVVKQFPSGFSNLTYLLRFGEREFE